MKCFFLGLSILLIQGCVYSSYTTKLDDSVPRERVNKTRLIINNSSNDGIYSATIGDELFILKRTTIGSSNTVIPQAPTGNKFPQGAEWTATYKYNDGKSGDIYVYTQST
ncbi:MAG TPA: hypothetical protein DEV85_09580 [Vibrio sp.]|uniref:hypothetical protein n=1 Tax=Vibrio TaxID=662 RepID=UPI000EED6072|nr:MULTISPECIES: hypothetical protein [Vibrio]HCH02123.1 hypothetical protein [Vibrio sp.]